MSVDVCLEVNQADSLMIDGTQISFAPPYRRIDVQEELERILGPLPDLNSGRFQKSGLFCSDFDDY